MKQAAKRSVLFPFILSVQLLLMGVLAASLHAARQAEPTSLSPDKRGQAMKLLAEFRRHLGESIELKLEYVASIPRTKSGKFRAVISNIEKDHLAEMSQIESLLTATDSENNAS